jgi:hypothetical protein
MKALIEYRMRPGHQFGLLLFNLIQFIKTHIFYDFGDLSYIILIYSPKIIIFCRLKKLMVKLFSWVYSSSCHHQNKEKSSVKIS